VDLTVDVTVDVTVDDAGPTTGDAADDVAGRAAVVAPPGGRSPISGLRVALADLVLASGT
jgi:hypothetical protein